MRFGLPESLGLPSFSFSFYVPMPGAYPESPSSDATGPSQPEVQLRRQRSRAEQREKRQRAPGPGPLELALQQVGSQEPQDDDEPAAKAPKLKRSKPPHFRFEHTGHEQHGLAKIRQRFIYIGNLPQVMTMEDVRSRLNRIGKVKSCSVSCCKGHVGRASEDAEGEYMAVAEFVHASHAEKAVRKHHQTKWLDRTVTVSLNPWDLPTGRRLRGADVSKPPVPANPRPTPYGQVKDTTVNRRDAALWRHTQDRRRKREEKVEQKRAERLKQQLGGASFPFTVV